MGILLLRIMAMIGALIGLYFTGQSQWFASALTWNIVALVALAIIVIKDIKETT